MQFRKSDFVDWGPAPAEHFTGQAWFGPMVEEGGPITVLGVAFEPGARIDWHSHPGGQVLHCVSGLGLVASADGERNNDELAKITREQVAAMRPVWQTGLVNPDFAAYAELCGGAGFKVDDPDDLGVVLGEALAVTDGPSLVEVTVSPNWM